MTETDVHQPPPTRLRTRAEIAEYLHLDKDSVSKLIEEEGLPAHKLGSGISSPWRFDLEEVQEWVRSRCFDRAEPAA